MRESMAIYPITAMERAMKLQLPVAHRDRLCCDCVPDLCSPHPCSSAVKRDYFLIGHNTSRAEKSRASQS